MKTSEDFGKAKIVKFELPSDMIKGEFFTTYAAINGSTDNAFLDLAIIAPDRSFHWYPDLGSWDSALDNGKLTFSNESYEKSCKCIVPNRGSGEYKFVMGLYENNFQNRRVVHYCEITKNL